MRIHPIAVIPLFLAVIALVMAGGTGGYLLLLTTGLAAAAVLVSLATISQYARSPAEVKQVPIENFSLWADIGEPGAELRRLSPDDLEAAVRIANADLGSLSSNADLLNARISLLLGRPEFVELTQEKFDGQTGHLSQDLRTVVKKLRTGKEFSAGVLDLIERCASQADRIANKLYDFQRGKPELVHIYVEPLRRAAEKLSRDLRLVFTNVSDFMKNASAQSESS
jgi:hypothetical protein